MDEKLTKQLDDMFAASAASKARADEKRDLEAEARAEFAASFAAVRDRTIVPALSEFVEYVRQNGWSGEITSSEETEPRRDSRGKTLDPGTTLGSKVQFFRGDKKPALGIGRSLPYFGIYCDARERRVYFIESTIGPNHGGSSGGAGHAKIEDLTADFIQQKLVSYFKKLLNNATPYYER